jgi:hypothetical protein
MGWPNAKNIPAEIRLAIITAKEVPAEIRFRSVFINFRDKMPYLMITADD